MSKEPSAPQFFDQKYFAAMTHGAVTESQLESLRWKGGGPPYIKLGRRVLYERQAVIDWLQSHTRTSTTDRTGAKS